MSETIGQTRIAEQLEQALASGEVRPDVWHWGRELLTRLQSPVRIVVMGPRHAGKSTLINMLAGAPVNPPGPRGQAVERIPVIETTAGEVCAVSFELADGETVRRAGRLHEAGVPPGAMRATQELPDPGLKSRMFIEVDLSGGERRRNALMEWAVEQADIALWCTGAFGADERMVWARVPDALKDHSYLVLTKADRQLMQGVLGDRIAALRDVVAEEFLGLYPVATIQAIAAQFQDGDNCSALWASSGGRALGLAVNRLVENGRMADRDNAMMFLKRHAPAHAPRQSPAHLPEADPESDAPLDPAIDRTHPETASPAPTEAVGTATIAATGVCDDILRLLQTRAEQMLGSLAGDGKADSERVLASCVETVNDLCDILRHADPGDPATGDLREDATESADMMLLFQYEQGEDAAADAVTLLLQLKNEISERAVG